MAWVLTAVGILGFKLAGRKVWWAWYVNLANQLLWAIYALASHQFAFLVGVAFYAWTFTGNAVLWTREHRASRTS